MSDKILSIWTVYERPLDYPQGFIARRFVISEGYAGPTDQVAFGATLEEVRSMLPPGLHRLERSKNDPPPVVESWI